LLACADLPLGEKWKRRKPVRAAPLFCLYF
jgi:hypothetical protein